MYQVVIAAGERFGLCFDELHNDSTTVKFAGRYAQARGRSIRGKRGPFITWGHSKDHRPDLKQLLYVLTTAKDGGVPVQFRAEAGNCNDSRTHVTSWEALCRVTKRKDFLYVADSKLCTEDALEHIDRHGGRFVTVLPRNRKEDKEFRAWVQDQAPAWELVWDRRHPRRAGGPRDRWHVLRAPLPSREGWPVIWVYSVLLQSRQAQARHDRMARAQQDLLALDRTCRGDRSRIRSPHEARRRADAILDRRHVQRYLTVTVTADDTHRFRQSRPGRPGPHTVYVRQSKRRWRVAWSVNEQAVAYDHMSDGMYPLLTNDRRLTPRQVLEAHKRQPTIEKRFQQAKSVLEIAPALLKNEGRIEALGLLFFFALLIQTLIERELRQAMQRADIRALPLYPEERLNRRPTAMQILRLFALPARHSLLAHDGRVIKIFYPKLTPIQSQVLELLGVPHMAYR